MIGLVIIISAFVGFCAGRLDRPQKARCRHWLKHFDSTRFIGPATWQTPCLAHSDNGCTYGLCRAHCKELCGPRCAGVV